MGQGQIDEFTAKLRQAGGTLLPLLFPLLTSHAFLTFYLLSPLDSGKYSCDVLEMLQREVTLLTERLEIMGPLIKLIVRRERIKKQMKVFEKAASNPNRLFGKSTQLLEEEKFRKIVATEFPKLTDTLRESLMKWERKYKEVFSYDGRSYLETMNEEAAAPNFALLHLKLFSSANNEGNNPYYFSLYILVLTLTCLYRYGCEFRCRWHCECSNDREERSRIR